MARPDFFPEIRIATSGDWNAANPLFSTRQGLQSLTINRGRSNVFDPVATAGRMNFNLWNDEGQNDAIHDAVLQTGRRVDLWANIENLATVRIWRGAVNKYEIPFGGKLPLTQTAATDRWDKVASYGPVVTEPGPVRTRMTEVLAAAGWVDQIITPGSWPSPDLGPIEANTVGQWFATVLRAVGGYLFIRRSGILQIDGRNAHTETTTPAGIVTGKDRPGTFGVFKNLAIERSDELLRRRIAGTYNGIPILFGGSPSTEQSETLNVGDVSALTMSRHTEGLVRRWHAAHSAPLPPAVSSIEFDHDAQTPDNLLWLLSRDLRDRVTIDYRPDNQPAFLADHIIESITMRFTVNQSARRLTIEWGLSPVALVDRLQPSTHTTWGSGALWGNPDTRWSY